MTTDGVSLPGSQVGPHTAPVSESDPPPPRLQAWEVAVPLPPTCSRSDADVALAGLAYLNPRIEESDDALSIVVNVQALTFELAAQYARARVRALLPPE
jgi:hypothetical protein